MTTPWCLPAGYVDQKPEQFFDHPTTVEWQPDVLPFAADLAATEEAGTIIDLGCGFARKLIGLDAPLRRIGADLPEVLEHVRHHDGIEWVDCDLEAPLPYRLTAAASDAVVVCSDVIEHLYDPTPLLNHFRTLLAADAAAVVVSTPDRDLMDYPPGHLGPPSNGAHAREWSLAELVMMLTERGFAVTHAGRTRTNTGTTSEKTSLVVIR